jgi:hypothetical protein
VDSAGFNLELLDQQGTVLDRTWVTERQRVQFTLPDGNDGPRSLYLRAEGARRGPSTATDPRQLDFRVFRIGSPQPSDIVSDGFTLGTGWYPYETFDGERFRWVGHEAELSISADGQASNILELEVSPGPGMEPSGLVLALTDENGNVLMREPVADRRTVRFALPTPSGAPQLLRLRAEGVESGQSAPGDPRQLDFRVFSIRFGAAQ